MTATTILRHPELSDVWAEFVFVTPAVAEKWLESNTRNRNVRERQVDGLAHDQERGNFYFNGATICFAKDGTLLDGQHRLLAHVKSGLEMWHLVVFGLETASQETMDTGLTRQVADQLRINGVPNSQHMAALARKLLLWEDGARTFKPHRRATATELLDLCYERDGLPESAGWAASNAKRVLAQPSVISLAHYLTHRIDPEKAAWFFARLADGVMLEAGHPVKTLRDRLSGHGRGRRERITEAEAMALIVMAWNAYRKGRTLKKMPLPSPLTSQSMPEPK